MAVRSYKPTSPGRRDGQVNDYLELTDKNRRPTKSLLEPLKKTGGRNHSGKITARHRGGGNKRMYRKIDFKRLKDGIGAKVVAITECLRVCSGCFRRIRSIPSRWSPSPASAVPAACPIT